MSYTRVGFNLPASLSRHFVARNSRENSKHILALSSGKRINSLEDDASGYFLARGLEANIRGLKQAVKNIEIAGNVLDIASNSYQTINNLLMNIKEKVVQGADDAFTSDQRAAIQGMIDAMVTEIDDSVVEGTFQGKTLIDGSFTGQVFQTGASAGQTFDVDLVAADAATLDVTGLDVSNAASATTSMATVDNALTTLHRAMQRAGEYLIRLRARSDALRVTIINTEQTRSGIEDADYARTRMREGKSALLQQMGFSSFKDAIAAPQQVLSLFT
ncbi:MAG: flagellin [Candidatus Marinimicrobia bacterium]|nr:flagellin [Candidatus Neomarinimicrobiota bacterium]